MDTDTNQVHGLNININYTAVYRPTRVVLKLTPRCQWLIISGHAVLTRVRLPSHCSRDVTLECTRAACSNIDRYKQNSTNFTGTFFPVHV